MRSRRAPLAAILQVNQNHQNDADKGHKAQKQEGARLGIDVEIHESSLPATRTAMAPNRSHRPHPHPNATGEKSRPRIYCPNISAAAARFAPSENCLASSARRAFPNFSIVGTVAIAVPEDRL